MNIYSLSVTSDLEANARAVAWLAAYLDRTLKEPYRSLCIANTWKENDAWKLTLVPEDIEVHAQAKQLVDTLKTRTELKRFMKQSWLEQEKRVPSLRFVGCNRWFRSCSIAWNIVENDEEWMVNNQYDPKERAREKAAQRAQDEEDLREGRITVEELRVRNAPLAQLLCRPDFSKSRMR